MELFKGKTRSLSRRKVDSRFGGTAREVDPLVCPRWAAPMRILAVVPDPDEVRSRTAWCRPLEPARLRRPTRAWWPRPSGDGEGAHLPRESLLSNRGRHRQAASPARAVPLCPGAVIDEADLQFSDDGAATSVGLPGPHVGFDVQAFLDTTPPASLASPRRRLGSTSARTRRAILLPSPRIDWAPRSGLGQIDLGVCCSCSQRIEVIH